ncbi:MAG: hypothetical protein ABIR55_15985, partial [Burkholderiaceae bacterium]
IDKACALEQGAFDSPGQMNTAAVLVLDSMRELTGAFRCDDPHGWNNLRLRSTVDEQPDRNGRSERILREWLSLGLALSGGVINAQLCAIVR